jgi:hypothetical protein
MNSLKCSLVASLILGAAVFGLATPGYCQSVWLETPLEHAQPDKGWWTTDRERYGAFVDLGATKPDLRIDGETQTGEVTIKPGTVVLVTFSEMYESEPMQKWWFAGKTGPAVGMVIGDYSVKMKDGAYLFHEPGVRLFKFKADEKGDLVMKFTLGLPKAQHSKEVSVTFKVQ